MSDLEKTPIPLRRELEKLHLIHDRDELEFVTSRVQKEKKIALRDDPVYRQMILQKKAEKIMTSELIHRQAQQNIIEIKTKIELSKDRSKKAFSEAESMQIQARALMQTLNPMSIARLTKRKSGWHCPDCGDTNATNKKVSGKGKNKQEKPYCFKCDTILVKDGEKVTRIKKKFSKEDHKEGWFP